jgi:hypothetical protein
VLFSTYKRVTVAAYVIIVVLVGLLFYAADPVAGWFWWLFASLFAIVLPIQFSRVQERMDEYGGRIPMPNGGLGLWGVDVVDDDPPSARDPDEPTDSGYDSNELDRGQPQRRCTSCGNLSRPGARFCDSCGKPLAR